MKSSNKIYKIDYTIDRSIKRYEVSFMVSINRESRLWQDNDLGTRHTSSVVDITLENWCNQSRRTNQTTYMFWDSLQELPMHRRICTSSIGTHGTTHAVIWKAWGSTRVTKIPTFTTRLKIESYKGQDKTCNKVRDEGSWYLVSSTSDRDGYKEYQQ